MDLDFIADLVGIAGPGASVAVHAGSVQHRFVLLLRIALTLFSSAKALARAVQNIKVNKVGLHSIHVEPNVSSHLLRQFQAEELSKRCTQLALSCDEACKGLEGTEFASITDEITA